MNLITNKTQEIECIVCRNSSKELVGIFTSVEEAAEEYLIDQTDIEESIRTHQYESGTGYWSREKCICNIKSPYQVPRYELDDLSVKRGQHKHERTSIAVVQLDPKYMSEVARFHSIYEAFQQTGARNIAACCKGVAKSSGGYKWMYAEEYDELVNDAPKYSQTELEFDDSELM